MANRGMRALASPRKPPSRRNNICGERTFRWPGLGTVVGGPVGTVVGAGVGALVGSSLPSQPSVVYQQPVVVGQTLPTSCTFYAVPQYPDYEYIILNNQRVVVDRRTHRVVRVIP